MIVNNIVPIIKTIPRIAIIGDAPGAEDEKAGLPFYGDVLAFILAQAGINRAHCFVGNVCQVRPPDDIIFKYSWRGPEIQNGLDALSRDLNRFIPDVCVLMGHTPMRAAGMGVDQKHKIFISEDRDSPLYGYTCLATYHPKSTTCVVPLLVKDLKSIILAHS